MLKEQIIYTEKKNKEKLKIFFQKEYNGLLNYAFPVCILLTDNNNIPWFYENYIGICSREFDDGGIWIWNTDAISYLETNHYSNSIININKLDDKIISWKFDVIKYIRENINSKIYNIIFVDEYYINTSLQYKKNHFIHEYLIYGYDDFNEELNAIGFDENMNFSELLMPYESFQEGFTAFLNENKKKPISDSCIYTITTNTKNNEYPFDLKRFLKRFNNYISAEIESDEKYFWGFYDLKEATFRYGIDVYDSLIYYFKNIMCNSVVGDYRLIHIFYENRNWMLERLKFIRNTYKDIYELSNCINSFSKVIDKIELVRNTFHKLSVFNGENGFKLKYVNNDYNFKQINKIIGLLIESKKEEAEILLEAYNILNNYA